MKHVVWKPVIKTDIKNFMPTSHWNNFDIIIARNWKIWITLTVKLLWTQKITESNLIELKISVIYWAWSDLWTYPIRNYLVYYKWATNLLKPNCKCNIIWSTGYRISCALVVEVRYGIYLVGRISAKFRWNCALQLKSIIFDKILVIDELILIIDKVEN
jgi:hypothetical protein